MTGMRSYCAQNSGDFRAQNVWDRGPGCLKTRHGQEASFLKCD